MDAGISFCDALKEKYCPEKLDDDFENIQISLRKRAIILQQLNHDKRLTLALDGCKINCSGDYGEIQNTCPLLEDLDLSHNMLSQWDQVLKIICQLKDLSFVNLSHNPLEPSFELDDNHAQTFPPLQKLVLNNTKIEFMSVCNLLHMFPRVNELHISLNQFGEVPNISDQFKNIESLHFTKNEIYEWEEIKKLGKIFPALKCLVISENPIDKIHDDFDSKDYFPLLESLNISKTEINDWSSFDQLVTFPSLKHVRLTGIPFLERYQDKKLRRQLLIARLPNIKQLNGGKLVESEQEDAERAFIRHYTKKDEKPKRYRELIKIHGEVPDLVDVVLSKSDYVVILLCGDIDKKTPMKICLSQTAGKLRNTLAKKYQLDLSQFRLFYGDSELCKANFGQRVEMRMNSKTLSAYHINDGDEIELQRLDKD